LIIKNKARTREPISLHLVFAFALFFALVLFLGFALTLLSIVTSITKKSVSRFLSSIDLKLLLIIIAII